MDQLQGVLTKRKKDLHGDHAEKYYPTREDVNRVLYFHNANLRYFFVSIFTRDEAKTICTNCARAVSITRLQNCCRALGLFIMMPLSAVFGAALQEYLNAKSLLVVAQ